jgi:hypothetical protein
MKYLPLIDDPVYGGVMKAMTLMENPPKIKKGMVPLGNHPLELS